MLDRPKPPVYSISQLTREFGVSTRTLRFYEQEGLLSPLRRGRTRLYRAADRTRLKLILRGKRLGFSLSDIRDIVTMYDQAAGERGQLSLLLERIAERRGELQNKRDDIDATLAELAHLEMLCRDRLQAIRAGDQANG